MQAEFKRNSSGIQAEFQKRDFVWLEEIATKRRVKLYDRKKSLACWNTWRNYVCKETRVGRAECVQNLKVIPLKGAFLQGD